MKLRKEIGTLDVRTIFMVCRILSLNGILWRCQCSRYMNSKGKDQANQSIFPVRALQHIKGRKEAFLEPGRIRYYLLQKNSHYILKTVRRYVG